MNMQKSTKIILAIFIGFIAIMVTVKIYLQHNPLLYIKIASFNSKEKLVEKQWKDLAGRWYVIDKDDTINARIDIDDKKWQTERFIYIGQVKGGKGPKWFRKKFELNTAIPADSVLLRLSLFDTQAKVFVNGKFIADSGFIYNRSICYKVPAKLFNKGKNLIAVRALLNIQNTGMVSVLKDELLLELTPTISLRGIWKFSTGDDFLYKNEHFNDSLWKGLYVPLIWDKQGYKDYDGIAWYRNTFTIDPNKYKDEDMVFIGGKIDDFNEVYINGVNVGGNIFKTLNTNKSDDWETLVIYKFPSSILKDTNLVSVRVYDATLFGGIYEGPIGIMSLQEFTHFYK